MSAFPAVAGQRNGLAASGGPGQVAPAARTRGDVPGTGPFRELRVRRPLRRHEHSPPDTCTAHTHALPIAGFRRIPVRPPLDRIRDRGFGLDLYPTGPVIAGGACGRQAVMAWMRSLISAATGSRSPSVELPVTPRLVRSAGRAREEHPNESSARTLTFLVARGSGRALQPCWSARAR